MKSCFISAPVNVDLSTLRNVLRAKGIQTILPFELEITGANFREQIEKAIRKADFCIAVFTGTSGNANVFFELGYAWAKRKRIVLIQSRDVNLPPNLAGFPSLKVEPDNSSSLSILLDQFLAQEPASRSHAYNQPKTKPLSLKAKDLVSHLRALGARATHAEFEKILAEAFRDSGIETFAEPKGANTRYDFALWVDELQHFVGNPILVEIKSRLTSTTAKKLRESFLTHRETEVGRALLVVFLEGPESEVELLSLGAPLILFIPAARFLSELENRSFGNFLKQERNRLVHGI